MDGTLAEGALDVHLGHKGTWAKAGEDSCGFIHSDIGEGVHLRINEVINAAPRWGGKVVDHTPPTSFLGYQANTGRAEVLQGWVREGSREATSCTLLTKRVINYTGIKTGRGKVGVKTGELWAIIANFKAKLDTMHEVGSKIFVGVRNKFALESERS